MAELPSLGSSETVLFQACVREPHYTKDLPSFAQIDKESPDTKDANRTKMKVFYKVWSGLTKYI
jgi:hypothetical protein